MVSSRSLIFYASLSLFTAVLSQCNDAKTVGLDGSKSPLGVGILSNPEAFFGSSAEPIGLQQINANGAVTTSSPAIFEGERSSNNTISFQLVDPLDASSGETVTFNFTTSDTNAIPLIDNTNGSAIVTSLSFTFDPAKQAITVTIPFFLNDEDCLTQDYTLIATDTTTNIPQYFTLKTTDTAKCAFIATNNGKGWKGNFARDGANNDSATDIADNACNTSGDKPANFPSVNYKALISVTGTANANASKARGIQYSGWPLAANTTYFIGSNNLKLFTTNGSGTYGFNPVIPQVVGSGTIWTGLNSSWNSSTAALSECAVPNSQSISASWTDDGSVSASAILGYYGNLGAVNSEFVSKLAATGGPDGSACRTTTRYFLCIAQ